MYHCDYDMWWSRHESAIQSGVLRAISASPIYVSDKIGESDPERIIPTIEDNGEVMPCDGAAALFNVNDGIVTDSLKLMAIPGIDSDTEYAAYEYFSKKFYRVNRNSSIEVTLKPDDQAVFSLYPIHTDAGGDYIMLDSTDKYVPIASKNKVKTAVKDIL